MDPEVVGYHLKQATSHLQSAYLTTKQIMDDESARSEIAPLWEEFLLQLFGDTQEKEQ
ncbi:MAG: hypothetical protein H0Z34_12170 [Brevibacillus sp.]|nr:hypothetical protein [Brevibacillus sp.]